MLVVRYLIALVFCVFMMATSLKIEQRRRRHADYKISTPDQLALQMERRGAHTDHSQLNRRRLLIWREEPHHSDNKRVEAQ